MAVSVDETTTGLCHRAIKIRKTNNKSPWLDGWPYQPVWSWNYERENVYIFHHLIKWVRALYQVFRLDPVTSLTLSPVPWNPVASKLLFSPVLKSSQGNYKCNYQTLQCFLLTVSVSFPLFLLLHSSGRRIIYPSNLQWLENLLILFYSLCLCSIADSCSSKKLFIHLYTPSDIASSTV